MNQADNAKVGEFEQTLHDPHNVGQNERFRIEAGHHQWNVGGALMVGNDQRFDVLLTARRQVGTFFNHCNWCKNN